VTAAQDEIAKIIAGFSYWERVRFAQIGGISAYDAGAAPVWSKPVKWLWDSIPYVEPKKRPPRSFVKVTLDGRGAYTVREAARVLDLGEYHLRHLLRRDEFVVRGVRVRRLTKKRRGNYRKIAA